MNEQQLQQAYTRHCETTGQTKTTRTGFEDFKAGFRLAQPAAGEPIGKVELFGINMTYVEWRDRKIPPLGTELYTAPPAAAPVAAGGPESDAKQLAVSLKLVRRWERPGQATEWEFEVPGSFNRHVVAASEQIARAIVAQDIRREAPPAAAHGDEAVRKDAARYQALRNTPEIFIGVAEGDDMVFLKSPDQLDQLADNAVAMRAQGDGEVQ